MEPLVRVEGLGKRYTLKGPESLPTLRDALSGVVGALGRRVGGQVADPPGTFWALRDVTLAVHPGDVLGIIGRNGAGKSTLLKLISRIIAPTTGHIELCGRVASLLEVGTGFHAELSGRENIFLNGAILGMRRQEIRRKFDEIVAFAEVDAFIDVPVKRYSSGMFLRLAFAVAAHLEPDVLIVDEILAVGDAAFQRKCLHKIEQVREQGHTVIFVSHDMRTVARLCPRTVILDAGRVVYDGSTREAVHRYLESGLGLTASREWPDPALAPGNAVARLRSVRVLPANGAAADVHRPIGIEVQFDVLQDGQVLAASLHVFNDEHLCLFTAPEQDGDLVRQPRSLGRHVATAWIPADLLAEGTLVVGVALYTRGSSTRHFFERDAIAFQVVDAVEGPSDPYFGAAGLIRPIVPWTSAFQAGVDSPMTPSA